MGKLCVSLQLLGMLFATCDAMVIGGRGSCCVQKTVGGVPYTLITEDDTTKYGCNENCIYARDDQPDGNQICFKDGDLESACNLDKDDGIIFIGPSFYSKESQVFLYPSLRKAACRPPTFPYINDPDGFFDYLNDHDGFFNYYVRMTDDGLEFCGGYSIWCFLLARNGTWTETTPLPARGDWSDSVEFAEGWWIAGPQMDKDTQIYNGPTLLWNGSAWQDYVYLPKPIEKFCMAKINSTHVFLSGGNVNAGPHLTESYIYSHATGFVQIANMTWGRRNHACGVLDGRYVVVAGGSAYSESEYFSLETMTWNEGPNVGFGDDPWGHKIVAQGNKMYMVTDWNIFALENADDPNEWKWVKSADLEFEAYNSDAILMKTEDCENWKV